MAQSLKIGIASEQTFVRLGLRYALETVAGIEIAEEITTPERLIGLQAGCHFQIVITNMWNYLSPSGSNKQTQLPFGLIALTEEYKEHYIDRMKSAGGKGFMLASATPEELLEAIDAVSGGGEYYCSTIQEKMEEERRHYHRTGMKKVKLTRTELMIMKYAFDELSDKEIAAKMNRSTRTIETHKRNIREKTKTNCNISCINFVVQKGLLLWQGMMILLRFLDEVGLLVVES